MNLNNITAGLVAVVVGYTSSVVLVIQAAQAAGASSEQISSWLLVLGLAMGVTSFGFSWAYKIPLLTAWSTPGAALLIGVVGGFSLAEIIGAFLVAAVATLAVGVSGLFSRLMDRIPQELAAAVLAGILLRFCIAVFADLSSAWLYGLSMIGAYLLGKRFFPRYVMLVLLLLALGLASADGSLRLDGIEWQWATPQFVMPAWSLEAIVSISLPLFIVTMSSQNLPGVAVLKAHDYPVKVNPVVSWIGACNVLIAPFGGFAMNLAAITAAICMGDEADPDRSRRYRAAMAAGIFYLLTGLSAASIVAVFLSFPVVLMKMLAGLALLGTLANSFGVAMGEARHRDHALLTFLVTASGLNVLGVDSSVWGLLIGGLSWYLVKR